MKKSNSNINNIFKKITKASLVIYCLICVVTFIVFISLSICLNNWDYLWGFLLCLGPGIAFVFISVLLPFEKIVQKDMSKGMIAWFVVGYIIKYALIICIPLIGFFFKYFDKWAMLVTTLIAPLVIITTKIIIANKVSKNNKTSEENTKNTIKF